VGVENLNGEADSFYLYLKKWPMGVEKQEYKNFHEEFFLPIL